VLYRLQQDDRFDVLKINLEHLKYETDVGTIIDTIAEEIGEGLNKSFTGIKSQSQFQKLFKKDNLDKPLILILDEFDALLEEGINAIVSAFRNIHIKRTDEKNKTGGQKTYLLHSVALIGVRSVLGIENAKGSPFNVQRSVHIPNLTYDEVKEMLRWYEKDSGRKLDTTVIDRLFYETNGQPGLTCWFGELLSEGFEDYPVNTSLPITMDDFEIVYAGATFALPNNNILNLISKAKQEPGKNMVLKMFRTDEKIQFRFDDTAMNLLYMNGVAAREMMDKKYYIKFSCPFVQKRLFHYFSYELFKEMGTLVEPFARIDHAITPTSLNIRELLKLYQTYLDNNKTWLFKEAPRRSDLKIYEAVYHFNLYSYLNEFLRSKGGSVYPEFPTGNGKIDLFIRFAGRDYGIELKSFTDRPGYRDALDQAARYGKQLGLKEIFLVTFVESIDEENRRIYGKDYSDLTGITVHPIFIQTGRL